MFTETQTKFRFRKAFRPWKVISNRKGWKLCKRNDKLTKGWILHANQPLASFALLSEWRDCRVIFHWFLCSRSNGNGFGSLIESLNNFSSCWFYANLIELNGNSAIHKKIIYDLPAQHFHSKSQWVNWNYLNRVQLRRSFVYLIFQFTSEKKTFEQ